MLIGHTAKLKSRALSRNMALEIKHVADLMGKQFRIPSYQRGYRWERKQIEQLLNDLAEFALSIGKLLSTRQSR